MNTKEWKLYTDGSFTPSFPSKSGWAFAIVHDDTLVSQQKGVVNAESRNIDGECEAVVQGLIRLSQLASPNDRVTIFYDYIGLEQWALGQWKTNKPVSISYKNRVKPFLESLSISWKKVKSHSGDKWNEHVDRLCQITT